MEDQTTPNNGQDQTIPATVAAPTPSETQQ